MHTDLDPQLLRSFLAVAEQLHFTRAAAELFLAQQVVSRHVAQLEDQLGADLFERSTRRVELTEAGRRLVPYAREILALQADAVSEITRGQGPLIVDVLGPESTAAAVVAHARRSSSGTEFVARHSGGTGASVAALVDGKRHVVFGRVVPDRLPAWVEHRLVRLEPLALLVPRGHRWFDIEEATGEMIGGMDIDISSGNEAAPEWTEMCASYLERVGAQPTRPHPTVEGAEETATHLEATGVPILTLADGPEIPRSRRVPLVSPTPLYSWSMAHRSELHHQGLDLLRESAAELASEKAWLEIPSDAWLPTEDRTRIS